LIGGVGAASARSLIKHARPPAELLERNENFTFNYLNKSGSLITAEATYYSEIGVNKVDDVVVTSMLPTEAQNLPVTNYPTREIATR
jgi:hypothetical protein